MEAVFVDCSKLESVMLQDMTFLWCLHTLLGPENLEPVPGDSELKAGYTLHRMLVYQRAQSHIH